MDSTGLALRTAMGALLRGLLQFFRPFNSFDGSDAVALCGVWCVWYGLERSPFPWVSAVAAGALLVWGAVLAGRGAD